MSSLPLLAPRVSLHLVQVLAHFLWQGLLIALLAAIFSRLLRRRSAQTQYLVHLAALALMILCLPATSLVLQTRQHPAPPPATVTSRPSLDAPPLNPASTAEPTRTPVADTPSTSPNPSPLTTTPPASLLRWNWPALAPYLTLVYLSGVGLLLARMVLGAAAGHRFRRHLMPVDDPLLLDMLAGQARALGLRFVPAVAWCQRAAVPVVVGVLRPTILLPLALTTSLAPQEIEAILTHELAHLRRYDPLVNFFQRIAEALLFFHPAVWHASRRIRLYREHCCDDLVVAVGKEPLVYARSLVRIVELGLDAAPLRRWRWSAALRASGDRPSQLRGRILRLLGDAEDSRVRLSRSGALALASLLIATLAIALGALRATATASDTKDKSPTTSPAPVELVLIARQAADYLRSIRSIDFTVHPLGSFDYRYLQDGDRYRLETLAKRLDRPAAEPTHIVAFDGKKHYSLSTGSPPGTLMISTKPGRPQMPPASADPFFAPYEWFFAMEHVATWSAATSLGAWKHALASGTLIADEPIAGVACHHVQINQPKVVLDVWFARDHGSVPMQWKSTLKSDGKVVIEFNVERYKLVDVGHQKLLIPLATRYSSTSIFVTARIYEDSLRINPPVDADQFAPKPAAGTEIYDADHPQAPPPPRPAASSTSTKTLSGLVVDDQGQPVADACLWLQVQEDRDAFFTREKSRFQVQGRSDAQGRFRLAVPRPWVDVVHAAALSDATLWAYAPGRQVAAKAGLARPLATQDQVEDLKLVLDPPSDTSLVVLDSSGQPLAGVTVQPLQYVAALASHDIRPQGIDMVPREVSQSLGAKTDSQGRAPLTALSRDHLLSVRLYDARLGSYLLYDDGKPGEKTVRLHAAGRVEGRVTADDPAAARRVKVQIITGHSNDTSLRGYAVAYTDDAGHFSAPAIASGELEVSVRVDETARTSWSGSVKGLKLAPGGTTQVELPIRRAILLSGFVRATENHDPVFGAVLRVSDAEQAQRIVTDLDGRFTASVVPGPVQVQITLAPEPYLKTENPVRTDVPAGKKDFALPPIELRTSQPLQGRLLDPDGRPAAGISIAACDPVSQRPYAYATTTDNRGRFTLHGLPQGTKPDDIDYRVAYDKMPAPANRPWISITQLNPLLLRLEHGPQPPPRLDVPTPVTARTQ